MVKTGQAWSGTIVTLDATGALAAASVGPAGALYVDGTANGASVTVTGSNPYKWAVTLPVLTAGQSVSMYITATVGGIATAAVVTEDIADIKRVSDLNDAAAAPSAATVASAVRTELAVELAHLDADVSDAGGGLTAQQTRDAMKLAPTAGTPAAGSVDAHLDSILAASGVSGTGTYTDTVTDGVDPLDNVLVQLSTDASGTNMVYSTHTAANGSFTMRPDPGTYYAWFELAGYSFTQGAQVVVT